MKSLVFILIPLLLSACEVVKGYPGPLLPDQEVATLIFRDDSDDYKITFDKKQIDNFPLTESQIGIQVLPGMHSVNFAWSFETADDGFDSGLMTSWKKFGNCSLSFIAKAGAEYIISAKSSNSGSWISDPSVTASTRKRCGRFLCQDEVVSKSLCTYDGRVPSVTLEIDL